MKHRSLLAFLLALCLLLSACALDPASPESTLPETKEETVSWESFAETNAETTQNQTEELTPGGDLPAFDPVGSEQNTPLTLSQIPAYSGSPFAVLQNNVPNFSSAELSPIGYESYGELDALGRVTQATASLGKDTMPKEGEERGSISSIYPTGWVQKQYDSVSGKWLFNRCHLIGWQLSAENDNKKNLVTGTKSFNVEGMLPFENMVADYIRETGNHVAYRVTPFFHEKELLCRGVEIEAYSVEDGGEGIAFHVFCYNTQPGITLDYATGNSALAAVPPVTTTVVTTTTKSHVQTPVAATYILNTSTKKIHKTTCSFAKKIAEKNRAESSLSVASLEGQGYTTCGHCF